MITPSTAPTMNALAAWLQRLDTLPLECDGMTRVISILLTRDAVAHNVVVGRLTVADIGIIPYHWWIELTGQFDGWFVDYRARLWLGETAAVPHGVFRPLTGCHYCGEVQHSPTSPLLLPIFGLITGYDGLQTFPPLLQASAGL